MNFQKNKRGNLPKYFRRNFHASCWKSSKDLTYLFSKILPKDKKKCWRIVNEISLEIAAACA